MLIFTESILQEDIRRERKKDRKIFFKTEGIAAKYETHYLKNIEYGCLNDCEK